MRHLDQISKEELAQKFKLCYETLLISDAKNEKLEQQVMELLDINNRMEYKLSIENRRRTKALEYEIFQLKNKIEELEKNN